MTGAKKNDYSELNKIYDWLDEKQEEILEYLSALVSIRSISVKTDNPEEPYGAPCKQILDKVLEDGKRDGFQVANYHNRVGRISLISDDNVQQKKAENEDGGIGIWVHLDVVPELNGWISDPYKTEIREGYIYGRGVSDNKGAAAGVLYILKAFQELGLQVRHPIHLYLGTDEEQGMSDVDDYLKYYKTPDFNLVPDAGFPAVAGEAGRLQFTLAPKDGLENYFVKIEGGRLHNIIPDKAYAEIRKFPGLSWEKLKKLKNIELDETDKIIRITAFGQAAHVAVAEKGQNAIWILTKALGELEGITDREKRIFTKLTEINKTPYGETLGIDGYDAKSGRTISSGTVISLKDGKLKLLNDTRFCVSACGDQLIDKIQSWSEKNEFTVEVQEKKEPYVNRDENSLRIVRNAYEHITGVQVDEFPIIKGGTYAGKLPNAIATGFVDIRDYKKPAGLSEGHGGAHQPNENMSVDKYMTGLKILVTIIAYLVL